jgi:glucokinase
MGVEAVEPRTAEGTSHYLGINIGGTRCSMTIGDGSGEILARCSWDTAAAAGPADTVAEITRQVEALRGGTPLWAAGVAIGGPLNTRTGEILGPPNLPGWDSVPLREILQERLGLPVAVAHDAAACALAEARFGGHDGCRSLVYLTCGTGFGAGFVVKGRIHKCAGGVHPEIGHWRLLEDGPEGFGRRGSAEGLCSGPGLSRIAAWLHPQRWAADPPAPSVVCALARGSDADALAVLDFHARMTGRVCAMIAELLCPERILLGSLAMHMGALWTDRVVGHYRAEVLDRIGGAVRVGPAALGDRLQDLSALVVAMQAADCA